jgi:hypothetical protein
VRDGFVNKYLNRILCFLLPRILAVQRFETSHAACLSLYSSPSSLLFFLLKSEKLRHALLNLKTNYIDFTLEFYSLP